MTTHRKFLITVMMALAVSGIASANSITLGPITTTTPVTTEATDWANTLAFAQFNSTLGILESVTIDISGQMQTTLTVTNTADAVGSSGNSRTELQIGLVDPDDDLGLDLNDSPAIDVLSAKYFYNLGFGQSSESGLLTSSYDSGAETYTSLNVLNEFSNPGGGTIDLMADTFTQTDLSNTGGNTNSSQVTTASLTGTVTYTYQAFTSQQVSSTPEPATLAMMGGGLIAFGLFGRRLRKKQQ